MAPRKQAKQAAAESIATAADGNVTPPKKRKAVATKPVAIMDEPKKIKTRVRQAKAEKHEPTSPPKKSRGKPKNAAVAPKNTAAKNDTKSKPKKTVNKRQKDTVEEDNNAVEKVTEQVVEKKARGGKTAMAKKAGTKPATVKPKAKVPAIKKRKNEDTIENGAGDSEKNAVEESLAKRTRRGRAVEESAAPATVQPAKVSRKRRNAQDTKETVAEAGDTQVTKEVEDEAENKAEVMVPNKKPRGRAKKTETNDASEVTSKGRPKKKSAKAEVAILSSEETETKEQSEQNTVIQENNSKAKNVKNTKKRNAKKAAPKAKRNAIESTNDVHLDETLELKDVEENGEAEMVQVAEPKQKKKNTGKTNVATDGKTELKGRQKKVQMATVSADEEEETKHATVKNKTTEKVNPTLETLNGSDVSLSKNDSQEKEENSETDKSNELTKNVETSNVKESSDNKLERSATFLCFEKRESS